jgi:hypothetical protein
MSPSRNSIGFADEALKRRVIISRPVIVETDAVVFAACILEWIGVGGARYSSFAKRLIGIFSLIVLRPSAKAITEPKSLPSRWLIVAVPASFRVITPSMPRSGNMFAKTVGPEVSWTGLTPS